MAPAGSGGTNGGSGGGTSAADLAKALSIPAAFAALLSSLAVTGVLGQMERNHGIAFAIACSFVFLAASLWVAVAIFPEPAAKPARKAPVSHGGAHRWLASNWRKSVQLFGVASLVIGLVFGVVGLIRTQNDPNEPSIVVNSLTATTLTATVAASGLSTRDTMEVHVDGLVGATSAEPSVTKGTSLYWASLGADSDGKINLPITATIPSGKNITAVAIVAFTGGQSDCLQLATKGRLKGKLVRDFGPGCVVALLPS
jgi:hypothetical protein